MAASVIAHAEAGRRPLGLEVLVSAAAVAGLRLALVDDEGLEVDGMTGEGARDGAWRRFPAHLDTRYGDEGWWHGDERYSRAKPWFTFDRDRATRDAWRQVRGTPDDHHIPGPGDSPQERRTARRRAAEERAREEFQRRLAAGEVSWPEPFECRCPPECDELDDWSAKPVHAPECPCGCDLG